MAVENDFLPFATGSGANVLPQSSYAALSAISTGYQAGIAQSAALNKTWRQSSIMAAVVAQFIVAQTGQTAIDDGTTATLLANLATAVGVAARQNPVLADTGAANTYVVSNLSAFTAYPTVSGLTIDVSILNANTGASTLNVDGLGAKPILGLGLQPLQGGELIVKGVACLMYIVASTVNSGNGAWVLLECAGGAQQVAPATASQHAVQLGQVGHGQCRLSVVSTTSLKLAPYNGNNVIVNGVPLQLPPAGVSVSNGSLAASTVYYVYLSGTTAAPVLALSTTTHVTGTNGVEVKSGDATQTLVGMVATNASTQFTDSQASRLCLNWFNRRKLAGSAIGTGFTTTATGATNLSTTLNILYLDWADDQPFQSLCGNMSNNTASGVTTVAGYYNGTQIGLAQSFASTTANFGCPYGTTSLIASNEGSINMISVYASVTSGTTATISCNQSLNIFG